MRIERTEVEVLSLAACRELSENSRLGFVSKVNVQKPGLLCANLRSTLGMHVSLRETRGGSRIQTWNRYAYVANNPLSNVDPLGLDDLPPMLPPGDGPDDCGYICDSPPISFPFPIPVDGGGGGGGGHPHPPSNPPSGSGGGAQPIHFPNETLGIPNGLNVNFGGPLGAILPSAICGNVGPCPTIGNDFQAAAAGAIGGSVLCQIFQPCGAIEDILLLGGLAVEGGALIYQMGRTQSNEWTDMARQFAPQDPCGWLAKQKGLPQNQDSATQQKIVQAQKFLKCRNVSKRIQ